MRRPSALWLSVPLALSAACAATPTNDIHGTGGSGGVTGSTTSASGGGGAGAGGAMTGGSGGGAVECSGALDQAGCSCATPGATRACFTGPAGAQNVGACHDGLQTCEQGGEFSKWGPCTGDVAPQPEVCSDDLDHNCNGAIGCEDSACVGLPGCCTAGATRACYDGPNGTDGIGSCHGGTQICDTTGAWQSCQGQSLPSSEFGHCADGVDNDCNGIGDCLDFACFFDLACLPGACTPGATQPCYGGPSGTAGVGPCHGGTQTCAADGHSWGPCVGEALPGPEGGHCGDGIDNDCNGVIDCMDPGCATAPSCCTPGGAPVDGTIWACSPSTLYRIDPASFAVTTIGNFNVGDQITDIALTPQGALYGISFTTLYSISKATGQATMIADVGGNGNNSLTFLPNGTLLASDSGGTVKVIDPASGTVTGVGSYGDNLGSSGDLVAVKSGIMYGTAPGSGGDLLIRVDVATGAATVVGPTGHDNVWGLAYSQARVIGLTTAGQLLRIDPQTGAATSVSQPGIAFWGATQSPLVEGNACP